MRLTYIAKDDEGNVGQTLPLTQGESRTIQVFLFNSDGTPFDYSPTVTTIAAKVYKDATGPSIAKTPTAITKAGAATSNLIGFQLALSNTDTASMVASNSGLPMLVTVTDNTGKVLELDFAALFTVTAPAVTN